MAEVGLNHLKFSFFPAITDVILNVHVNIIVYFDAVANRDPQTLISSFYLQDWKTEWNDKRTKETHWCPERYFKKGQVINLENLMAVE